MLTVEREASAAADWPAQDTESRGWNCIQEPRRWTLWKESVITNFFLHVSKSRLEYETESVASIVMALSYLFTFVRDVVKVKNLECE